MAGKTRIPIFGAGQKFVTVDPRATEGATFGENLRWPDGTLVTAADFAGGAAGPDSPVSRTLWSLVLEIPANVTALEDATGTTGLFAVTGDGTGAFREIAVAADELTASNGDGVAGNPTLGLADVADAGGGTLQRTAFDAKGRKTGTSAATTDDLPEGATNLYFTGERADARIAVAKADPDGIASLVGGKLDPGQLPALAITETFVVNTEAAMLALDCQQGDVAVRTDLNQSFILTAEPASTLSNWQDLLNPTSPVTSVFGRVGSVVAASGDYTAAQVGADAAGSAASALASAQTYADGKIASTITNGDTTHSPSGDAVFDAFAASGLLTATAPTVTDMDSLGGGITTFFRAGVAATGNPAALAGSGYYLSYDASNGFQFFFIASVQRWFYRRFRPGGWQAWVETTQDSGTYTPTATGMVNVTSATGVAATWSRSGSTVTVSGRVDVIVTAAGVFTQISVSVPVPSAFTAGTQGSGVVTWNQGSTYVGSGILTSNVGANLLNVQFLPPNTGSYNLRFSVVYPIL